MNRHVVLLFALAAPSVCAFGVDALPVAPSPRSPTTAQLVRQLGNENYAEREEALRLLSVSPLEDPPPALVEALRSSNPEVRLRAAEVIKIIRARADLLRDKRTLGRERAFAKRGAADLFVESTATWDIPAGDERLWQPVLDIGVTLYRYAYEEAKPFAKETHRQWHLTSGGAYHPTAVSTANFWIVSPNPLYVKSSEPYRIPDKNADERPIFYLAGGIRASEVTAPQMVNKNLIISGGKVQVGRVVDRSVILANGDVYVADRVGNSIIICDGNVEIDGYFSNSVIVARGNITTKKHASASTLIAGGKVTIGDKEWVSKFGAPTIIKEKERSAYGFIRFFEPEQVGVEVKTVGKEVEVAKVAVGKPFTEAGVRVGDVVLKVDGTAIADPEQFRRALRQAVVKGEGALTIRRGEKSETVRVTFPD
jgi:hypothetical protein